MPVQINELTVRVTVTENAPSSNTTSGNTADGQVETNAIIRELVDEVMTVLKNKNER